MRVSSASLDLTQRVDFDSIQITNLSNDTDLKQANNTDAVTVDEQNKQLKSRKAHHTAAVAHKKMLESMLESAKAEELKKLTADQRETLANIAGEYQGAWKIAGPQTRGHTISLGCKELATINQAIERAEADLSARKASPIRYAPIKGSLKALESPADKEDEYPAPTRTLARDADSPSQSGLLLIRIHSLQESL